MEEVDSMRHVPGEPHLVRGEDHGHSSLRQTTDHGEHFTDEFWVERGRDLIKEQNLGVDHQGPHNGCSLLLATGEPIWEVVHLVAEAEAFEKFNRPALRLVGGHTVGSSWPKCDVVEHGHVGEEVERLKHDADPLADLVGVDTSRVNILTVEADRPFVDCFEKVDASQDRRLATAAWADEAHDLVLVDRQVDTGQHLLLPERLVDVLHLELVAHMEETDR